MLETIILYDFGDIPYNDDYTLVFFVVVSLTKNNRKRVSIQETNRTEIIQKYNFSNKEKATDCKNLHVMTIIIKSRNFFLLKYS